jgi:uncharacterized protein with von Willebrand factor type A (vWA) domain
MVQRYRYSRWDGTQNLSGLDDDQVMEEMAEDLLNDGDVQRALRNLMRRGMQDREGNPTMGLRDLLERLRERRQQRLQQNNLDDVMDDLKRRMDDIVQTERQGMDRRLEETSERRAEQGDDATLDRLMERLEQQVQRNKETLDNLPESLAGATKELSEYEFMDPDAARKFQELMEMLQGRMMDNMMQNMRQGLQQMTPEAMAELREMLRGLNDMLQEEMRGGRPDFEGFMDRFGQSFGPNPPQSLDELLEQMAGQMGQMQSLMDSMTPEQRQELQDLMESVMDPETAQEMAELGALLSQLMPDRFGGPREFTGEDPLTMEQAMEAMRELQSMDELERQIQQVTRRGDIDGLDLDAVESLVDEDARRDLERLQRIARMLEEAGYVQRNGERLELTPQGIRKIAQKALKEVFHHMMKDRLGRHDLYTRGRAGDISGSTKPFEFGDPFDLALGKTIANAVVRNGPGTPVRMIPQDFELVEREELTQAATVLLLDQSRSMGYFGSFQAAKRATFALSALMKSLFPRDALYIVGFSDYAVEIKNEDIPQTSWNAWTSGTNMHHALMLSRKLLSRHKSATKQVIMVTDGEPTAHLEGDRAYFDYPPSPRTIAETLKEVRRCTQEHITINTFMLESNAYLLDFIDKLTKINRGRAFYSTPERLGEYILVDYVSNRRKRVAA